MTERVKLIWDFHGPNAKNIAEHHTKHLGEFVEAKNIENTILGEEEITSMHYIAFFVVEKHLMDTLRATLKPTRGQLYDEI